MNMINISFSHSHESISRRARELWLRLGQPDDQDLAIWLQAERELHALARDALRIIDQEQLQEAFDSFDPVAGRRSPTALDLT
jgi:hypothetical protein